MEYCNIDLSDLIVSQNGLRNHRQIEKMVQFVNAGGRFTKDACLAQVILTNTNKCNIFSRPPLMHIALMEDGQLVLHDGHHRAVALQMGNRRHIEPSEYVILPYKYADYYELHPEIGWFTPFDLPYEVRLPEFAHFKKMAQEAYATEGLAGVKAIIRGFRHHYAENRRFITVSELTQEFEFESESKSKKTINNKEQDYAKAM